MEAKIEMLKTGSLKPYPKNSRTHSAEQIAILEADGKTFDDVAASRGVQNNPKTGANNAICS